MKDILLKIVTPERSLFENRVSQVSVSTTTGQVTILPSHVPMVSVLQPGEIIAKQEGKEEDLMSVSGGFIEVLSDQVIILADTAERAAEIDEQRAEEARARAQELMSKKVLDAEQFAYFSAQLEKELARLRVARRYKKNRGHLPSEFSK